MMSAHCSTLKKDPLPERISGRGSDCPRTQNVAHCPLEGLGIVPKWRSVESGQNYGRIGAANQGEIPEKAAHRSWEEGCGDFGAGRGCNRERNRKEFSEKTKFEK